MAWNIVHDFYKLLLQWFYFALLFFLELDGQVPIHFHWMEKSSVNILLNFSFYVPQK